MRQRINNKFPPPMSDTPPPTSTSTISTYSIQIVLVNKDATLTTCKIKEYSPDKLFKKCGFKSDTGFNCVQKWKLKVAKEKWAIYLFGKLKGKQENRYDFPPPADHTMLFGTGALVAHSKQNGEYVPRNLNVERWKLIEEQLLGGIYDLGDDEQDEEDARVEQDDDDELTNAQPEMITKSGYLKDGFVVSDEDEFEHHKHNHKHSKGQKSHGSVEEQDETILHPEDYMYY